MARNTSFDLDGIHTPDRRYIVVRGRLWRASNPALPDKERAALTRELMTARRAIGAALRTRDRDAEQAARKVVGRVKRALGERGPVWWTDGSPDLNRHLVRTTPYAEWHQGLTLLAKTLRRLLARGSASVCPSEVARAASPDEWRGRMHAVRELARHLASRGVIVITQRGRSLDPAGPIRGPVRLSLASSRPGGDPS